MIFGHDIECLCDGRAPLNSDGVVDHAVLCTLDDSHLTCLILYRHVLVYDTDTSFTGNGNSHLTLRDGIHSCRNERHVELDVTREPCTQFYGLWQHFRISWNQQDVVKCETVHHNLIGNK